MSTSTIAENSGPCPARSALPSASSDAMPPSEAPIAIGRLPARCASVARDRGRVGGEIRERVMAAGDPFAVAMPALIERVGRGTRARELLGGAPPGMARLPAAVQQQHRLALLAIHIGHQPVAGGARKHRGRGLQMLHGRSCRNLIALGLEHLVADRDHVIAVRNVEPAPVRHQRGKLVRRAGDVVLGADRDQRRARGCS